MTHVLIAVDDSEDAVRVAATAHGLFGEGATYSVISVASHAPVIWGDNALRWGYAYPLMAPGLGLVGGLPLVIHDQGDPDHPVELPTEIAERRAHDIADEAGIPDATPIGDSGDPVEAILSAADAGAADVIVIGSHRHSWLSNLFGANVGRSVVREARIPVLVAR